MKINRLDHTKSLYPHFFDKTDDSNFTKHLKVVGEPQQNIRHKLKTIEWSRILEKPLQIWKVQTEPYVYDMHFKCFVPYLKEFNVYRNPIIDEDEEIVKTPILENGEVIGYEERVFHKSFDNDNVNFYETTLADIQTPVYKTETVDDEVIEYRRIIPSDTYVLEVITWDDYRFIKGFPENDYTVKEDNILQYRYNETFLSIKLEEVSYSKYLTFRVHKDRIKEILIRKNDKPFFKQEFITDLIADKPLTDFSYTYFDDSITNETTYNQGDFNSFHDLEEIDYNHIKAYFAEQDNDEYVFRLPLGEDDFDDNGVVKDTYDLEVSTYEKRYHCLHEYDRVYTKRYNGYDKQANDCFDHDYSLDIIGALLNVPRLRFYQVYKNNKYYLSRTYPSYNNRSTEDDYHYMKRIQYYISNYNHIVFPILEFWKWYQTDATIKSRKLIVGEMDYSHFHTLNNELDCYTDLDVEELEATSIISYSLNKATSIKGSSTMVVRGTTSWHETILVDNVYVVPSIDYRLRYGLGNNEDIVSIRLICFNREGKVIRTTNIIPNPYDPSYEEELHGYNTTTDYSYTDTSISIPSDTSSIQIVLESDSSFDYVDVTFERITVSNFDNPYITTDEDYNSNVYELYAVYEDIPSNIRIGGSDRFNILFKRSLPLTKRGYFYIDMNQNTTTTLKAESDFKLYATNILSEDDRSSEGDYEVLVEDFVQPLFNYVLEYTIECEEEGYYDANEGEVVGLDSDDLAVTTITYYRGYGNESATTEEFSDRIYADTPTRIRYEFTTPLDTEEFVINITSSNNMTLTDIKLQRVEELLNSEVEYTE